MSHLWYFLVKSADEVIHLYEACLIASRQPLELLRESAPDMIRLGSDHFESPLGFTLVNDWLLKTCRVGLWLWNYLAPAALVLHILYKAGCVYEITSLILVKR